MDLFFNELSASPPAPDRSTARDWLLTLQITLHAAVRRGLPNVLRTHEGFWQALLADGYTVSDWLRDPTLDRERQRFMRSAVGKAPFLEALHRDAEAVQGGIVEARFAERPGIGIALAALHDAPAVSLPAPAFTVDPLEIVLSTLGDAGLSEAKAAICNLHSPAAVERRAAWLTQRQREEVVSGEELLRRSPQILAHVDFTESAIEQLGALRGTEKPFPYVVRHLFALNERARTWVDGEAFADGYPFPCSEESSSTLAALGETRTFRCPDGVRRVFSWHSKVACEAWRIHFRTSPEARRVLVGYIGKHLPLP